jgi:nucleoside-diphosphate-sugar epimerase
MRVVVTGGSGRIGMWVVRELAASHQVVIFDRLAPLDPPPGVTYKLGEIEDLGSLYDVLRGSDAVVHLAAIPSNEFHPGATVFRTNVLGTYMLGEAASRLAIRQVVNASSINVLGIPYAERPIGPLALPIDETHPNRPQDAYGLSKLLGEETLAAFHRRSGLRTISLRPPLVVLPENYPGLIARLDDPGLLHRNLWSYVDVRDLATGVRLALENESLACEALFMTADDAMAREPLSELIPRFYPGTRKLAAELTATAPAIVSSRAKQLLGYSPRWSWRAIQMSNP